MVCLCFLFFLLLAGQQNITKRPVSNCFTLLNFVLQEKPNALIERPDYTTGERIPGWMIAPYEEKQLHEVSLDLSVGDTTKDTLKELIPEKKLPMFFGIIRYHDQWQGKHETRFCWIFVEPLLPTGKRRFMLGGNDHWNRQT